MPATPFKIIDISHWQGDVDFAVAKAKSGIQGAMIRCGYGSPNPSQIDRQFKNHMREAIAANMLIGIYHYGYARTEAEAEAEAGFALSIIQDYKNYINFPVAYDVEDSTMIVGREQTTKNVLAFCRKIKAAGYKPMVYVNLLWTREYINMKAIDDAGIDVWFAEYNSYVKYTGNYTMWQFTDALSIAGYPEPVDASWVYKNYV